MHKKIPDSYSKREGGNPGNSGLSSQLVKHTIEKKKKKYKALSNVVDQIHINSNIFHNQFQLKAVMIEIHMSFL